MMRKSFAMEILAGVGLGCCLASQAYAAPGSGNLYGTDSGSGNLVVLNTASGAASVVGYTGLGSTPSLAVDPQSGFMYIGTGGGSPVLYTVNPVTGTSTIVGDSGLGFSGISGMDFNSDGTLYATVNIVGDGGTGGDHLATIDTTTGLATVIGPYGTCEGTSDPGFGSGSCSIEGIGGIAFDNSGDLWAVHRGRGAPGEPGLYSISSATGAAAFVAPILDANGATPPNGVTSLQFSCDGTLYGGTNEGRLITIDQSTGRFAFVGGDSANISRALAGLAFEQNCPMDHFVCYKVKPLPNRPAKGKKRRNRTERVIIQNEFGEQRFLVLGPQILCAPSSKLELNQNKKKNRK